MIWSRRTHGSISSWSGSVSAPAHWSSSERPLSVKTVWVNGVRHAILSLDDPLLNYQAHSFFRRPGSSSASDTTSSFGSKNELDECLVKLRGALDSAEKIRLPPIDNSPVHSPRRESSPCLSPVLPNLPQNPLSDRVLQWLDLANKGQPLATSLLPKRSRNISAIKSAQAKRKLHTRSATVDFSRDDNNNENTNENNNNSQGKQVAPISTTAVPNELTKSHLSDLQPFSSPDKEGPTKNVQVTPVIAPQRYEPLRPLTAWPSTSKSNRPQLHIFIPSLNALKTDFSDDFCSTYNSE